MTSTSAGSSTTSSSNATAKDDDNGSVVGIGTSFEAALISATVIGFLCILHFLWLVRYKTWFFHLMLFSAFLECLSLSGRALTTRGDSGTLEITVAYMLPILIPSLMAAACYMVFGRLVWFVTPPEKLRARLLWIPPRCITPLFVSFDIIAFVVQFIGVGAVIVATAALDGDSNDANRITNIGYAVLKLGLLLQLACFGIFAIIGFRYFFVSRQWTLPPVPGLKRPWKQMLAAINLSATLITLRSIYRIFEFTSASARKEWMFYVFEVLPLSVVFIIFLFIHPGHCLPRFFTRLRLKKRDLKSKLAAERGLELGPYQHF